ncbi:hypothetical protein M446_0745 [Methylobacterium sp. 4-46]|uniref:hypothetical protein n=1 Tax=unclassified Methylobacterium TaxID=2615210 RepID=UPI000152C4CF|nr:MULTISPECIES: hypothetical protein [Methylobacterium]ACA15303.1 hypothetical protein M446_0745 [Methylobacterium sp. 4-46]WFT81029.1 hypothetical protein QA634_03750 [Methylobacterium nodulans]
MPRTVTCQIVEKAADGFAVVGVMAPDKPFLRDGFATRAEAAAWIDGLREIMAACGAPVRHLDDGDPDGLARRQEAAPARRSGTRRAACAPAPPCARLPHPTSG